MGLVTSPVCASFQLEEETALHFVCVCLTLATLKTRIFGKPIMNASEFTEVSASEILQFAFQSGRVLLLSGVAPPSLIHPSIEIQNLMIVCLKMAKIQGSDGRIDKCKIAILNIDSILN
jgi:hypothetical protein